MIQSGGSVNELPATHFQEMTIAVDRAERFDKINHRSFGSGGGMPADDCLRERSKCPSPLSSATSNTFKVVTMFPSIGMARQLPRFVKPDSAAPVCEIPGPMVQPAQHAGAPHRAVPPQTTLETRPLGCAPCPVEVSLRSAPFNERTLRGDGAEVVTDIGPARNLGKTRKT